MAKFSYNKANRDNAVKITVFERLPKGAYVCKILKAEEVKNKNGEGSHIEIGFDIAEGEYKDFYKKQFEANTNEDKKWPADARYCINVPTDDSPEWQVQQWDTFWTIVEDSNEGYTFDGDDKKLKGKLFGGLFHISQSEYNGKVYDHTRLKWTRAAQDVRDGKYGTLPKDKLLDATSKPSGNTDDSDFMNLPEGADEEIPF